MRTHIVRRLAKALPIPLLALLSVTTLQAQDQADRYKPRVFYGGNIYASFGSTTNVGASPMVGLQVLRQLGVGIGGTYMYSKSGDYSWSTYGGRVFAQFDIIPQAYAKAEFNYLHYVNYFKGTQYGTTNVPYLFLGAGVRQRISRGLYANAEVLFDVLRDQNSQYRDGKPLFSVGIVAGF